MDGANNGPVHFRMPHAVVCLCSGHKVQIMQMPLFSTSGRVQSCSACALCIDDVTI